MMQAVQDALISERTPRVQSRSAVTGRFADYLELTKPGITVFIMLSAATGYLLAPVRADRGWLHFFITVLGTGLTSAAAATFNQYIERDLDARMMRTGKRPLPSGRVPAAGAFWLGSALALCGLLPMLLWVGWQPAALAALSFVTYLFVYTPLKTRTVWCTLVGGLPGALPIVAGWTGRGDVRDLGAWALFAIVFMWQMPHFYSLAWLYRHDYERGGFKMLTHYDKTGLLTHRVSLFTAILLAVCTALPAWAGVSGLVYAFFAMILAAVFVGAASAMRPSAMEAGARRVFLLSLMYLPAVYVLLLLDRTIS